MNTWKIVYNKFSPEHESLREALCTLGNGYFGTRGAAPETEASKIHYPGTYIAGVYNTLPTDVAGRTINNEDFVNCPNWLMLNFKIDDEPWFDRLKVKILSWKKELNMRSGILSRRLRWQDAHGRIVRIQNERIVSMAHPHCGAFKYTITPENFDGCITVRCGIDGLIINAGVDRYKQLSSKHLEPCSHGHFGDNGIYLQMQTNQSKIQISTAHRIQIYHNNNKIEPELKRISHGRQRIFHEFKLDVKAKESYTIEKLVSIYTSRDQGVADNCMIAQDTVSQIQSFNHLKQPHQSRWRALWSKLDIEIDGDLMMQLILRLHTFHLVQSVSTYNEDIDAGMPVRGLHGEAYRGHIFWDELYVYPFYNLHAPEITRALLMYRYRRLGAAKDLAKQHGFRGAMYPWQSASTGEETTQIIHLNPMSGTWGPDYSSRQRHVSIAIAYNILTYFNSTGDRDFMDRYGAEMMLEIAQMWSTMAEFNPEKGRYEICGVMGPDEFHEKYPADQLDRYPKAKDGGLYNNAYTNVLVVWLLDKTLSVLNDMLDPADREALMFKTEITEADLERWKDQIEKMYVPMDEDGLIHQFDGYIDLEELEWDEYKRNYDNIHRIDRILKSEGLSPDCFKVAKQADVLMIFYLLSYDELDSIFKKMQYPFSKDTIKKCFDYYYPRTSHGSTLSMVVHSYVASLLDYNDISYSLFNNALESDLHDTQGGTTQEGIHAGVMGATLDVFLRIYAGLVIKEDRIAIAPKFPPQVTNLKFSVRYKSVWFEIFIEPNIIRMTAQPLHDFSIQVQQPISIEVNGQVVSLFPNQEHIVDLKTR